MKTINLTNDDAAQVRAILRTHAEMQDRSALQLESTFIAHVGDAESAADMELTINETTQDCDNLNRIADLFI